jgi:membrane protein implicated in regulation of membrane protease activity
MTWGRPLVWLILLKFFILFAILRVFFFKPAMAGLSDEQKSEQVGERLTGGATTFDSTETMNV